MSAPDFLAVGHVTLDRIDGVVRPGGAAAYAAVTALRLGLSAGILTSHGDDFPLDALPPQIEVVTVPSPATTMFEHRPARGRRRLRLAARAGSLGPADLPGDWSGAGLVLLAPVADEVDPALGHAFPEAAVSAAAQGWLRRFATDGTVTRRPWRPDGALLGRLQALFLSAEDVRGQEPRLTEWVQRVPLAVVTAGARGSLLYVGGDRHELSPRPTRAVDSTGAGDVFAAAFLARYAAGDDAWQAAAAATCAASLSVEGTGWSAVPDRARLDAALAGYLADWTWGGLSGGPREPGLERTR